MEDNLFDDYENDKYGIHSVESNSGNELTDMNTLPDGLPQPLTEGKESIIEGKRFNINKNEISFRGVSVSNHDGTNMFNKILNLPEVKELMKSLDKHQKLGITFYVKTEE
jgi:hypothetical protein